MKATICYTKRAPEGEANGVDVGEGFALQSDAFRVQHGAVRATPIKQTTCCPLHNELVPCEVEVINATEKNPTPALFSDGFELLSGLSTKGMPDADRVKELEMEDYFSFLENVSKEKTGASFAKVFCYTARNVTKNPSGAGNWAHTDIAPGSWPTVLDNLEADELPPGLPLDYANRARSAKRICVLTAWRFLGPSPKCSHSQLMVLDHQSLDAETDVLPFMLRNGDRVGHNYRLAAESATKHKWLYFPEMDANDDVLFFIAYDTAQSFPSKLSFSTLFHGAALGPKDLPTRQSIDCRVILGWE